MNTDITEIEQLKAKMRAAAGWISNLADTLDEDHPEWSVDEARRISSGEFRSAKEWMNDQWSDYLV